MVEGRQQAACFEEIALDDGGRHLSLLGDGEVEVEGEHARQGRHIDDGVGNEIVVFEKGAGIVPAVAQDGLMALLRPLLKKAGVFQVAGLRIGAGQGLLQVVEQAVEVDGDDVIGMDGVQVFLVGEPSAGEVPARFTGGADVPVYLFFVAAALFDGLYIIAVHFGAGVGAAIPVAVEEAAVLQAHHVLDGGVAGGGLLHAVHPELVLFFQLRQVLLVHLTAFLTGQQLHHRSKEGRLGAGQEIVAVAVGNKADGIDQVGEVVDHILDHVHLSGGLQAQHGEVAVPIVDLPKASAGNDIGVGQRDEGAADRRRIVGLPGEHRPEFVDVFGGAAAGVALITGSILLGQVEISEHKCLQVKAFHSFFRLVFVEYLIGGVFRRTVHKGLPIGEYLLHLNVDKELAEALLRREVLFGFPVFDNAFRGLFTGSGYCE